MTSAFSMRRTRCVIPDQQVSVFVTTVRYILGVFIRTCIEIVESVLGVHTVLQGYFRSKTPWVIWLPVVTGEWAASIPTSCFLSVFETHAGVWDQSCPFERWEASIWVHSVIISVITLLINESLSSDIGRSGWEGCTSMCWVVGVPDSCTELCWLGVLGLSCCRSPMRCAGQGHQLLGECCRHPAMEVEVKSQWPNADWH